MVEYTTYDYWLMGLMFFSAFMHIVMFILLGVCNEAAKQGRDSAKNRHDNLVADYRELSVKIASNTDTVNNCALVTRNMHNCLIKDWDEWAERSKRDDKAALKRFLIKELNNEEEYGDD
jgi:hypothetical protein